MTKVTTLVGHTYRVLYLAMSPDGQTIVTGAGDETLRFWNLNNNVSGSTRRCDSPSTTNAGHTRSSTAAATSVMYIPTFGGIR